MTVEHLDLDGGNVLVPITKSGKFRVAPLTPEAVKYIRGLPPPWRSVHRPLVDRPAGTVEARRPPSDDGAPGEAAGLAAARSAT